jgi:hypothetical protein
VGGDKDGNNHVYIDIKVYCYQDSRWNDFVSTYVDEVLGRIPDQAVQVQLARNFDAIVAEAASNERSGTEF